MVKSVMYNYDEDENEKISKRQRRKPRAALCKHALCSSSFPRRSFFWDRVSIAAAFEATFLNILNKTTRNFSRLRDAAFFIAQPDVNME